MTEVLLHIHVKKEGKMLIDPDRIKLLRSINSTHSLLTASKQIGISYNKAWKLLEAMNKTTNKPLVDKSRGGQGGGGAVISEYGKLILAEYDALESMVNQFTKKLNIEVNL